MTNWATTMQKNNFSPTNILKKHASKGGCCLDLGCGESPIGKFLLEKGMSVYFLDSNKEVTNKLRKELKNRKKAKIIQKNFLDHSAKKSFDIILMKGIFTKLSFSEILIVLKILNKNLKKNGLAYITWIRDKKYVAFDLTTNHLKSLLGKRFCTIYEKTFFKTDSDWHRHKISSLILQKTDRFK